jgi:hypothetical protein
MTLYELLDKHWGAWLWILAVIALVVIGGAIERVAAVIAAVLGKRKD